ncbi:MAG: MlaD family protein [Gemmatimonas sp.]|jgi:phospholipid/cholesterol/gamma-HCH transport system substrate-binding protein|uniref:MlaD family protein n=1 Tax=Gemmatimonas sp. TaxID=1962908 RepID=UPI0022C9FCC4|nr:MlaD family protein [Gemmatimonas sp.]MCA2984856.1 MCE family protein [Gemmatimonas sp.]MCA2988617.1 MCE family protein [Gemmatimonas sp.]MCE2955333.1 MlaD family protein [Gemmatimonas sp.]MCZ8012410.1 MlaD family protein [Gemmatimonas sp.]MCZ8266661.1 MlaD family protein [Gemmatimonas sp.]
MTTKRRDEVLVGLLLMVALALALGGTIWIARGGLAKGYTMHARFPWGAGLKQGQPVLLAGVQVGFVEKVELIPDGTLDVTLQVQDQYRIPSGTTASVEANGIFGDMLIALTPVKGIEGKMAKGDTIPTGAGSPGVAQLLEKGDSIALNVRALSDEARRQFVDSGGVREVRQTVADLTKLVAQLSTVAAEQSRQLTLTQSQLRKTLSSVDSAMVDSTLVNLRATSANFEQLSRDFRETNTQVQSLVQKVNTGPGTAGRLMNDPAVYARMDTLLARLDSLAIDLRKNPRKYINLKIF